MIEPEDSTACSIKIKLALRTFLTPPSCPKMSSTVFLIQFLAEGVLGLISLLSPFLGYSSPTFPVQLQGYGALAVESWCLGTNRQISLQSNTK